MEQEDCDLSADEILNRIYWQLHTKSGFIHLPFQNIVRVLVEKNEYWQNTYIRYDSVLYFARSDSVLCFIALGIPEGGIGKERYGYDLLISSASLDPKSTLGMSEAILRANIIFGGNKRTPYVHSQILADGSGMLRTRFMGLHRSIVSSMTRKPAYSDTAFFGRILITPPLYKSSLVDHIARFIVQASYSL